MAEIQANWCQNGDSQQGILIKRNVKPYSERSYITEVFHGQRMFNPFTIVHPISVNLEAVIGTKCMDNITGRA